MTLLANRNLAIWLLGVLFVVHPFIHFIDGGIIDALMVSLMQRVGQES